MPSLAILQPYVSEEPSDFAALAVSCGKFIDAWLAKGGEPTDDEVIGFCRGKALHIHNVARNLRHELMRVGRSGSALCLAQIVFRRCSSSGGRNAWKQTLL